MKNKNLRYITILLVLLCLGSISYYFNYQLLRVPNVGNMNGVELTIPKEYQLFSPKYVGENLWGPNASPSPQRTYQSGIDSFSIVMKWPSLEHRYENNNEDSYKSRYTRNYKEWIDFGVQSYFENMSPEQIQKVKSNPGTIFRLLHHYLDDTQKRLPPNVHYKIKGQDPVTGLTYAVLEGENLENPMLWNHTLYWNGDSFKTTTTFIRCPNGKFAPHIHPDCTQYFEINTLHARVKLSYSKELIADWWRAQQQVQNFVLGLEHAQNEL